MTSANSLGKAPSFTLPRLDGDPLHFEGRGPVLITLSAVRWGGPQHHIDADKQAYEMAHKCRIPVWNILVHAQRDEARGFKKEFQPRADEYLYDADGSVSVQTYGGNDWFCWILIDGRGDIIYRSFPRPLSLELKLGVLQH